MKTKPATMARTDRHREKMMDAFLRRDPDSDGVFFAAVTSTGIFCRPSCRARKPKPENVLFFDSAREALLAGYRPCKICRPVEMRPDSSGHVAALLSELESRPENPIRDFDLRRRGLDPSTIRRHFLKELGMSFHAYQRALRLGKAFGQIRHGTRVTDVAFDAGFDSLSGFGEAFRRQFGAAPSKAGSKEGPSGVLSVTRIATPLGLMVAGAVEGKICLLEFADRRALPTELEDLCRRLRVASVPGRDPVFDLVDRELSEYFAGTRREFSIPLLYPASEFRPSVWKELLAIPYGRTRSYAEQATLLNRPSAVRAIASANGANRISILIPCHRVIGSDGSLTGYGGGLWRKRYLLDLESGAAPERDRSAED